MDSFWQIALLVGGFLIIAIAADRISQLFKKIRLPLITGLLFTGLLAGPYIFKLLPEGSGTDLEFINDLSLAFIAFAAGAELYLKELRSSLKSIAWNTTGQLLIVFSLGALFVYYLSDLIPFMRDGDEATKIAISLMAGTMFVARSPSSAIAIINEMRAKGPFTNVTLGVTVIIDVLVIILFTICYSLSGTLIKGADIDIQIFLILLCELIAAMVIGFLLSKMLELIMKFGVYDQLKVVLILASGWGIYLLSHFVKHYSGEHWGFHFHFEPLLTCIVASFLVTNFSRFRPEFQEILHNTGPMIYVAFFTLTGASMSLDVIVLVWSAALIFFAIRLGALMLGSVVGGILARDGWKTIRMGWMPYVTQAGVGLGLATQVAGEFEGWGPTFATTIVAMIVVNQILGPPLYKLAIQWAGEDHSRAQTPEFDGVRDAVVFGLDPQSLALARQLKQNKWNAKVVTFQKDINPANYPDVDVVILRETSEAALQEIEMGAAEAAVLMMDDDHNYELCELIYEKFGTKDVVVRLENRGNFDKFHELGALIVEPSTAIVSLLDHFVRSPMAASLLLGMDEAQDTIDLEVLDPQLHGVYLRNLRLPSDVIILSITRGGHMIISHGYTRLRQGDIVTLVGSKESLDKVTLMFDKE